MKADFGGYATRNDLKCSDGLTIKAGAFQHNAGQRVPLVWQHQHNDASNILGHAVLEHRDDGVYAHAFFNDTPKAKDAKISVKHGDLQALSIYANNLRKNGFDVLHGDIREVSLVVAGANPGAYIDQVSLAHGDSPNTGMIIVTNLVLAHSADDDNEEEYMDTDTVEAVLATLDEDQEAAVNHMLAQALSNSKKIDSADPIEERIPEIFETFDDDQKAAVHHMLGEALAHAEGGAVATDTNKEMTVKDVFDAMTEDQKSVVYFMIGEAVKGDSGTAAHGDDSELGTTLTHAIKEGFDNMSRNVFEKAGAEVEAGTILSHAEVATIFADAEKEKSLKTVLQHAVTTYGVDNIEALFPDARVVGENPELISRQMEWVKEVLDNTKHSPFAKVRSITFDITAEEARAKGYMKGNLKKEEVVKVLRRSTGPATIYKKQKLDRDDIIDMDFGIVAWLWAEITVMLKAELAQAILFGDGRDSDHEDKVQDPEGANAGDGIRSIVHDHELYVHQSVLDANVGAKDAVKAMVRARSKWKGTGKPTLFLSDNFLTDIMLEEDKFGRALYETEQALADKLRVAKIVVVDIIDNTEDLLGIMVNLVDYTIGTNKGGELSSFEDFDIDYNQYKYLTETRLSGGLTKPNSAVVIRRQLGTKAIPAGPTFAANKITIPTVTGVIYEIDDVVKTGQITITEDTEVKAVAAEGFYIPFGSTTSWSFNFTAG